ncbi:hypothetical protein [Persicirhabdus sediminis]|uniref:PEP-CTERM protein-sorting domain-containing protein n=1 Tax=Persicirhabdus sediminis TaxID=454144 RepID=A0A8J7MD33_9BACT|nr:hypothetical protein [Persicirhabdus sediminis]MBK1790310.1 hypothetical protein [Persicirhabdus sediminis]
MKNWLAAPLTLLALVSPLSAVVIRDDVFTNNGGQLDPSVDHVDAGYSQHSSFAQQDVFKACLQWGDGVSANSSSGTWLGNANGSSYILIAGHSSKSANGFVSTGFEYTDWQGQTTTLSSASVTHWRNDVADIAILQIDQPIVILDAVNPIFYDGDQEAGKVVTWIGTGFRGTGLAGQDFDNFGSGRAAGQNIIDGAMTATTFEFDFDSAAHTSLQLEAHQASGDSGAAGWIQVNGQWMIAGLVSESEYPEVYQANNIMVRTSGTLDWITSTYSGAFTAVPEPSSAIYAALAALVFVSQRRRS